MRDEIEAFENAITQVRRGVHGTLEDLNITLDKLRYAAYALQRAEKERFINTNTGE